MNEPEGKASGTVAEASGTVAEPTGMVAEPSGTVAEPTAEHSGMKAAATKREVKLGFPFFAVGFPFCCGFLFSLLRRTRLRLLC